MVLNNHIKFQLAKLHSATETINDDSLLLSAFNTESQQSGFYHIVFPIRQQMPNILTMDNVAYNAFQ